MEGVNGGNISGQVQEGVYEGVGNGWGTASWGSRRGENGVDVKGWSRREGVCPLPPLPLDESLDLFPS